MQFKAEYSIIAQKEKAVKTNTAKTERDANNMSMIEQAREQLVKNPYGMITGMEFEELERDHCRGSLELKEQVSNIYGTMHGGALFTLADMCMGAAARSDGNRYVTQNASVNYIRGVFKGTAHCEANVLHRGKTMCVVEGRITDDDGNLCLSATFSFFCLGK